MTPLAFAIGSIFGALVGVLTMALCITAKRADEDLQCSYHVNGKWTFNPELFTLSYDDRACVLVCGYSPNQQDRIWLGEALADALNQANLPLAFTGPVPARPLNIDFRTPGLENSIFTGARKRGAQ